MPQIKVPDYNASERQTKFHTSTAFETLYGGAAGGGKTAAICAEAVSLCLEHSGIRVYIFRRTIPELKQSVVPEVHKQCAEYIKAGHMKYHAQDRQYRFDNDSIIQLAFLDDPTDMYLYQSAEIHVLFFDELTHFTQAEYEFVRTRVRSEDPKYPLKIMAGTNPGGIGHGWVKSYFIDAAAPETVHIDNVRYEELLQDGIPKSTAKYMATRQFIPAKVTDHPSAKFRASYLANLASISDPSLKKALRDGDWDTFKGMVFMEFSRTKLIDGKYKPWHVVEPFEVPEHWVRWFAYDYGHKQPAGLWFAKDPTTDRIYLYREYYSSMIGIKDQAREILMLEGRERIRFRIADPSLWKQKGDLDSGENIADKFTKEGVHFTPGNNDRAAGKEAVHEALSTADDGLPNMQVFANCNNTIRTLPQLPYDPHRPEDVDTDAEDHLYDTLRYGLLNSRQAVQNIKIYKPEKMLARKYRR